MHTACIKKFFGTATLPLLDYTTEQLDQLALQIIQEQISLTGVQPKLSLHLKEHEGCKRLTSRSLSVQPAAPGQQYKWVHPRSGSGSPPQGR